MKFITHIFKILILHLHWNLIVIFVSIFLKKIFVNKRFDKLLLEKEEQRKVSSDKIKTIGIIASDEITKWLDVKKDAITVFNDTEISICSFRPFSKKNQISKAHFSEKSFGWKAQVKDNNLNQFLNEPFDLLIGYFNKNNLYTELAVLQSNATFKVGFAKVNSKLYDMEIKDVPKNTIRFFEELKKYLQILNKL